MPDDDQHEGHGLTLDARRMLNIAGVTHVDSFTETHILLQTTMGPLHIRGKSLTIERLDLDAGRVVAHGDIDSLVYQEGGRRRTRENVWRQLWG